MFLITTPSHSSMHAYFISFQNQFKIMLVISRRFLALLSIKCQFSQVGCSILRELLLQEATQEVLGLDVVNQIIFISKNGEEKYLKITSFFMFQKKFFKLQKFVKKNLPTTITIFTSFNHIMGSPQSFENLQTCQELQIGYPLCSVQMNAYLDISFVRAIKCSYDIQLTYNHTGFYCTKLIIFLFKNLWAMG